MKLTQFEKLALHCLKLLLLEKHLHVKLFIEKCISLGEINGNIYEGIETHFNEYVEFLESLNITFRS